MKILVTGGRTYDNAKFMAEVMDYLRVTVGIEQVIEGGAAGADKLARVWALNRHITYRTFPALWSAPCTVNCYPNHRRKKADGTTYCPAQGVYRNRLMLRVSEPDIVVGFPGGNGTEDMLKRAKSAKVKTIAFTDDRLSCVPKLARFVESEMISNPTLWSAL